MITWLRKKASQTNIFYFILATIIIAVASFVPIIKTYNHLTIGGDVIIPLIPKFSYHNAYEWVEYANGQYASNDYFIWISLFFLLRVFFGSIYHSAFALQFLVLFFSGMGVYSIFNLFNTKNKLWALVPALAFLYSPYTYDHMLYFYGTAAIVWLVYFLFKFLHTKSLSFLQVIIISVLVGLIGNLPNPKYHFIIFLIYVLGIALSLLLRLLTLKTIKNNLLSFFLIIICTLYLSLPFINFGRNFASDSNLTVKTVQKEQGGNEQTIDYGYATIEKMITLWHTPSLNQDDVALMNSDIFTFSYYMLAIAVFGIFPLLIDTVSFLQKRMYFLWYFFAAFFIFLSKSSNPPFGIYYQSIVTQIKIFAFMRTTAGIVIYAGLFYSLLIGVVFQTLMNKFVRYKIAILVIGCSIIGISGYHVWSGAHFRNFSPVNGYLDRHEYGIRVPDDYFKAAYFLANKKLTTKIDILPGATGYQNNYWGYFGPIIYPWIFKQPTITIDLSSRTPSFPGQTTTRYRLYDKSVIMDKNDRIRLENSLKTGKKVYSSSTIDIYRQENNQYNPLLYTLKMDKSHNPAIEYKYIDPTKFRVRAHGVTDTFFLVFTTNFHPLWRLYIKPSGNDKYLQQSWEGIKKSYKIIPGNEADQATTEDLDQYIKNGTISTIGNTSVQLIQYKYQNKDIAQKSQITYPTNFISKEFKNAIQNDNLPTGHLYETLFLSPLKQIAHTKYNGFANQWVINPQEICSKTEQCVRNADGSYDIELVGEFEAQKYTYLGYCISAVTLTCIVLLIGYQTVINQRKNARVH